MRSLRSALIFIGVAGLTLVSLTVAVVLTSEQSTTRVGIAALTILPSLSFIGTGLFAWYRRPNNRCGALMTAAGFAWLMIPLQLADNQVLYTLSLIFENSAWIFLVGLLLAYPSGRIESKSHWWLLGAIIVDGFVIGVIWLLFAGPRLGQPASQCVSCPDNPLTIAENASIASALDSFASLAAVVLILWTIVVLVRRFRSFEGVNRVAIRPLLVAGTVTIGLLATTIFTEDLGVSDDFTDAMFIGTALAMSAVPFAFLLGLLRSRITGAEAVGQLVAVLGEGGEAAIDIEQSLADALGDPELRLVYWLPDRETYADSEGLPARLPETGDALRLTPIEYDGELIAGVINDASIADDQRMVRSAGSAAALALRNQRLEVELRATVEELRASRMRIVQTSDQARRELERNLHDGAQQHLVSMALTLRMAESKVDSDPAEAKELLGQASADLAEATTELRELARGIHPAILTDRGLGAALGALATRSSVPVELGDVPDDRLPPPVESAAYFVVSEALTNVARYSKASRADVSVHVDGGRATIEVRDDGVGGADMDGGTGLRGLQDRVAALGGRLLISSNADSGTTVRAELPCAQS